MLNDLDCIFWIKKAPKVTFDEGMFHICFAVGKRATVEMVMSPATFLKLRAQSSETVAQWQVDDLDKVRKLKH
jgi:hypothetical protein